MIKKTFLLLLLMLTLFSSNSFSQNYWNSTSRKNINSQKNKILSRGNTPQEYVLASLNLNSFKNHLNLKSKNSKSIIALPNSDGKLKRFTIKETSYLAADLAAKFPMIKTYSAQGVDDPTAVAKISIGIDGLHAIILSGNEGTTYIDPFTKNRKEYIIYKRKHLKSNENDFRCEIENSVKEIISTPSLNRNANDGKLRTYKIAIACTGEYSQFHLNRQNIDQSATDAEKKAAILSAMNTTMARVNGIYERDLAMRMIIVSDNEKLIFLDATTDGLTNDDSYALIEESQQKCDNIIGDANYDIGHTFSTGGGGLASQGLCVSGVKGKGITGNGQPISDPFDIDYVAHEIGHQLGAGHTFNGTAGNCGGNIGATSVEPGSGTTIMAYAGICSPQNVQNNSDDYFHAISIAQMWNHIQSNPGCATITDTGNAAPTANAGTDFSIPKSTPFVLKGTATDDQNVSSLTYNWEQIDTESAPVPLVSTTTKGPAFRSLPSTSSPNRYFPTLPNVINDSSNEWEVLPSVARELNFSLTVRDNNSGGGSSARDDIEVTVTDAEPFIVNVPNSNVSWGTGSTQTITWNKGTTDIAPINCTKVNIKLSTDGGLTFPILIKGDTPNDGTEEITIPNNATSSARIMVEAADNIFYNVNTSNFSILPNPDFTITNTTGDLSICNKAVNKQIFAIDYKTLIGFNENVIFTVTGTPTNSTFTLTPSTTTTSGIINLTVSNLNNSVIGDYTMKVTATSASITKNIDILFNINDNLCKSIGNTDSQISTTLVNFGEINNTSTKTTGYSDYKSITTEVIKGNKYTLKTSANTDGNKTVKTFAWIDWNQNCLFDAEEQYDLGETINKNGATSKSGLEITIPTTAFIGTTTLRVSSKLTSIGDPKSCELNFNGEVEDYTITITPTYTFTNTTGHLSICNKAVNELSYTLDYKTFNDFNEDVSFSVTGTPANTTSVFDPTSSNGSGSINLTLSNLNNATVGDYTMSVTATSASITKSVDILFNVNDNICKSSGNLESQISLTNVKFGEIDNTSTKSTGYSDFRSISTGVVRGENYDLNTIINTDGDNTVKTYAWIDWNQNCLFDANETYDLTSNTSAITIPEDAILGSTILRISVKLNEFSQSCKSNFNGEVEDYTINVEESFATNTTLFTDLKIGKVPLPLNEKLTVQFKVKVKDLITIRLFNLTGRLIDTQTFSTVSSRFNKEIQFTKVSSGMYFIQIENGGQIKTKKIIIK
ncbi:hypothetical protein CXF68_07475 [Tenacibaculum sp. Bg11-29]|uniref:GEVED domain-containing protein n=1 Tax=Tenacibaculum sp. Bg11-29 TaxID=2058306 RepID=UPI000C31C92B|nr:GEVED domain-containing protein [Tenacibaculum sp. Bg11-29]PKH50546.1 hypothetical protein CXF68_07475 [Tenacibaculum sp. Bg11-29]